MRKDLAVAIRANAAMREATNRCILVKPRELCVGLQPCATTTIEKRPPMQQVGSCVHASPVSTCVLELEESNRAAFEFRFRPTRGDPESRTHRYLRRSIVFFDGAVVTSLDR